MIVPVKDFNQLMSAAVERLSQNTAITNFYPGSIARAILEVVNEHIAQFYQTLDFNIAMAFVSKAQGYFLDLLGELLNCKRRPGETDDNYRYRICHQVEVVAGCNYTALCLEILSLPGVRDVIMRPLTFGPGSFSVYVIPEIGNLPSKELINIVQTLIDEKAAYGVKGVAVEPGAVVIDIKIQLVTSDISNKSVIIQSVQRVVWDYIANLPPGGELVINELIQRVMDISDNIVDIKIYYFYINDQPAPLVNQKLNWDEVFVPRLIEVT